MLLLLEKNKSKLGEVSTKGLQWQHWGQATFRTQDQQMCQRTEEQSRPIQGWARLQSQELGYRGQCPGDFPSVLLKWWNRGGKFFPLHTLASFWEGRPSGDGLIPHTYPHVIPA